MHLKSFCFKNLTIFYYSAEVVYLHPNAILKVRTGIRVKLPIGTYGRITGRSSLLWLGVDVKSTFDILTEMTII